MLKIPEFWLERRAATFGGTLRMYVTYTQSPRMSPAARPYSTRENEFVCTYLQMLDVWSVECYMKHIL